MLAMKTRYAMVALANLAKEYGNGPILSSRIATEEKIPQRFLEVILLDLKKMGVLGSKPGKDGGYYLIKNPADVTLYDVVRHFEGAISMLYCVSEKQYQPCEFCKNEENCKIRKVFLTIRDKTNEVLSQTNLLEIIP
jgi:Rrf2 family protein